VRPSQDLVRIYKQTENFFTDNGLEIRGRKMKGEGIEKDFYPCLSLAYIQDKERPIQFTIVTRQAMGTSSQKVGAIEHMLHRNLNQDDGRGLGEPNNDNSRVRVSVYLMVQPPLTSVRLARRLALSLQHYPRMMYGVATEGQKKWSNIYNPIYSPLISQLPTNTHLVSLKARDAVTDDIVLRFAHIFETSQHASFSKQVTLNWDRLFQNWEVSSKRERSLALTMDVQTAQARKPSLLPSTELLHHVSGLPPEFTKQESQNTQEEGVFISQAALEEMKKNKQNEENNNNNNDDNNNNKADINNNNINQNEEKNNNDNNNDKPAARTPRGRTLRSIEEDVAPAFPPPSVDHLVLNPMEIKSFFVHLNKKKRQQTNTAILPPMMERPPRGEDPANIELQPIESGQPLQENRNAEVGDVELTTMLLLSVICTGLIIAIYVRLRLPSRKSGGEASRRKDYIV